MYIPASVLVLGIILWFIYRDKVSDEISSLRNSIDDLRPHHRDDYAAYLDLDSTKKPQGVNKYEYTFQESQDRGQLGVPYDAGIEKIHEKYNARKIEFKNEEINKEIFDNIQSAYNRLIKLPIFTEPKKVEKVNENKEHDTSDSIVITCGGCHKQNRVYKHQGSFKLTCSSCGRKSTIET